MGYLYPFSLSDPPISHLEISSHSFISWVFHFPLSLILFPSSLISIRTFHLFSIIRDLPIIVKEHPSVP
jgi:hypothetical protein